MATNILIVFYSTYGHIHTMAKAVQEGAAAVEGVDARLRRISELEEARQALTGDEAYQQAQDAMADIARVTVTHDDLRWADGIVWGTATRYGNMTAQMKQFIDSTGALWQNGELANQPASSRRRQRSTGGRRPRF